MHEGRERSTVSRRYSQSSRRQSTAERDNTNSGYPDGGATHHETPNQQVLPQSSAYQGPGNLPVGNGQGLPISSTGSSILHIDHHHIRLKDADMRPKLKKKSSFSA